MPVIISILCSYLYFTWVLKIANNLFTIIYLIFHVSLIICFLLNLTRRPQNRFLFSKNPVNDPKDPLWSVRTTLRTTGLNNSFSFLLICSFKNGLIKINNVDIDAVGEMDSNVFVRNPYIELADEFQLPQMVALLMSRVVECGFASNQFLYFVVIIFDGPSVARRNVGVKIITKKCSEPSVTSRSFTALSS